MATVGDALAAWALFAAVGSMAGLLAGLLGIGGGLVLVPTLIYVFLAQGLPSDTALPLAFGTSLACILFTSVSSARAHSAQGNVLWRVCGWAAPGIVAARPSAPRLRARFPATLCAWVWRSTSP